jgi:GT2 family glycosyltransferase
LINKKVYIVILNYKGWEDTIECLESVFKLSYDNYQVIVVDNSPTLQSIEEIEKWAQGESHYIIGSHFPSLVTPLIIKPINYKILSEEESSIKVCKEPLLIIKAKKNLGFSSGNNLGIKYALRVNDFSYCWLLNNDTVVEKNSLINQVNYLDKRENLNIGILGSKLMYYYNPEIIQAIGGTFNAKFFTTSHVAEGLNINVKKDKKDKIDYIVGASMMLSNKFLKNVGVLCEDFFLYYEELDWAFRAKKNNWNIDWCQESIVYHKEGGSIGSSHNPKKRSYFSELHVFKSRLIFYKKYKNNTNLFYISSFLIILNRVRRLQFKLALNFFKILLNYT